MMDNFFRYVIYGTLAFVMLCCLAFCASCSMFGGGDRVCSEGFLKKVEYETDRNGDRVIKSIACFPKDGQRP
jgi:hypothetical protein